MLDIHTHLYWKDFDTDRDEVIRRAKAAGVSKMISVGTDMETSRKAIEVAQAHEGIWASVGIHPHSFNEEKKYVIPSESSSRGIFDEQSRSLDKLGMTEEVERLRELAKHPKVIAIGECGLDYFSHDPKKSITDEQKAAQRDGFLVQLGLARELNLPIIIHCRDAYEDLYSILQSAIINLQSAILHCYQGDTDITKRFLELPNVYFSFAGNITYPVKQALVRTKDDLGEPVKLVPLERLFTETDCPFLAPQAKRGERDEPAFVQYVVQKMAELHGVDVAAVEAKTTENFKRVFGVVS